MIKTTENNIFGNDTRLDGTRIPNQDEWPTLKVEAPIMPYRAEDCVGLGSSTVYFALTI